MSVLNKKPYVESVLDSLTSEQLSSLKTLLNGAESTLFRSFINNSYALTTSDKGVSHCVLECKDRVFTGYLLFNNSYCVLLAYQEKSQQMKIVKIDYANDKYEIIDEELSIVELRSLCDEVAESGGDAWVEEMKDLISYSSDEDVLSISTSLYIGEDLEVNGDLKSKTMESENPLWENNLSFTDTGSFTITPIYCKMILWNHTLRLIISLKYTNNTENAANIPGLYPSAFDLPNEIADKIYDVDGKKVSENPLNPSTQITIRSAVANVATYTGGSVGTTVFAFRRYNKQVNVSLGGASISVPAGESRYCYAEMSINV